MSVDLDICVNTYEKNVKIRASEKLHILSCAVKNIVCTRGVERERERVKEFGFWEIRDKDVICTLDKKDVGTSFGRRFSEGIFSRT